MNEYEKRLRDALTKYHNMTPEDVERAALAFIAEHRAALSSARDVTLEEARDTLGGAFREVDAIRSEGPAYRSGAKDLHAMAQGRLAALQSQPAQVVPVAKVQNALSRRIVYAESEGHTYVAKELRAVLHDLGVELDAAPANCLVCDAKAGEPHKMSCRPSNREAAARRAETGRDGVAKTEPALDATCGACGASYGTHKKDGRRTAWDGHREALLCAGFTTSGE